MDADKYAYRILWSEEDQAHVGLCAEFPSLSWVAKSQRSALDGIRKVVKEVIADMRKSREDIPEPLFSRTYSGKFVVRVPPETHRKLALRAAEEGVSLNRIVSQKLAL